MSYSQYSLHKANGHGFLTGNIVGMITNYHTPMPTLNGNLVTLILTVAHRQMPGSIFKSCQKLQSKEPQAWDNLKPKQAATNRLRKIYSTQQSSTSQTLPAPSCLNPKLNQLTHFLTSISLTENKAATITVQRLHQNDWLSALRE